MQSKIANLKSKIVCVLCLACCLRPAYSSNVEIEVKDVDRANEEWHSNRNSRLLEFKHFEAIVKDSTGKQYAMVASVAGNKYMYEAHAWLANTDEWYEIYKATPKMESEGSDVWTADRKLTYTGNISTGWRIKARGAEAAFEVLSTPERPVSQFSVNGSSADFDGYISFRTKIAGKIVIHDKSISVSGLGYCIHTFGDMGDHTAWMYVGFKDEKLCLTAMNAQFDADRLNLFVTVDGDMKMNQYRQDRVSWKELDQNTWQISAAFSRSSSQSMSQPDPGVEEQDSRRLDMTIHLIKPRPANKDQPYAKYSLGFIDLSKTILHEYLAEIQTTVTDPNGQMEFRSLGIAIRFDLMR